MRIARRLVYVIIQINSMYYCPSGVLDPHDPGTVELVAF